MRPLSFSNIAGILTFVFSILMIVLGGNAVAYILFSIVLIAVGIVQLAAYMQRKKVKNS